MRLLLAVPAAMLVRLGVWLAICGAVFALVVLVGGIEYVAGHG